MSINRCAPCFSQPRKWSILGYMPPRVDRDPIAAFIVALKHTTEIKDAPARERDTKVITDGMPLAQLSKVVHALLDQLTAKPTTFQIGRELQVVEDSVFLAVQRLAAKDKASARALASALDSSTFETRGPGTPWLWPDVSDSAVRVKAAISLRCLTFLSNENGIRGDTTCVRYDSNFYEMMWKNVRSPRPVPPQSSVPATHVEGVLGMLYPSTGRVTKNPESAPASLIIALTNIASPDVALTIATRAHAAFTAQNGRLSNVLDSVGTNEYKFPASVNAADCERALFHFSVLLAALGRLGGVADSLLQKPRALIAKHQWLVAQTALYPADILNLPDADVAKFKSATLLIARAVAGKPAAHPPDIEALQRKSAGALESLHSGRLRLKAREGFELPLFAMDLNYRERHSEKVGGRMRYPSVEWKPKGETSDLVENAFEQVAAFVHAAARWGVLSRDVTDHVKEVVRWSWHPCMDKVFPVLAAVFDPSFPPALLKDAADLSFIAREAIVVRGVRLFQEVRRWDPNQNALRFNIDWLQNVLENTVRGGSDDGASAASAEMRDLLFHRRYQHAEELTLAARLNNDLNETHPTDGSKFNREQLFKVFGALIHLNGVCATMSETAAVAFARDVGGFLRNGATLHARLQPTLRAAYAGAISNIHDDVARRAVISEIGNPSA